MTDVPGPHLLSRPTWLCTTCHLPWPCGFARQRLTDESNGSRTALTSLMSGFLGDAIEDLADVEVAVLWNRFVGWVRAGSEQEQP